MAVLPNGRTVPCSIRSGASGVSADFTERIVFANIREIRGSIPDRRQTPDNRNRVGQSAAIQVEVEWGTLSPFPV